MLNASRSVHLTLIALLALVGILLSGCGGDRPEDQGSGSGMVVEGGAQHVHGLGINPADNALYIATHSGLWRARDGQSRARRVGSIEHDLMGFAIAGPDEFLASGHPGIDDDLPQQLGLQRSSDGGRSWQTVSLLGKADLHVLRASGPRLYGVDSGTGRLLTSADGGRSWQQRTAPAPVFDLAIAADDAERLIIATEAGLFSSTNTGDTWRPVRTDIAGLLAWPSENVLYLVDGDGVVSRSADAGGQFKRVGAIGAQPEAFAADGTGGLYAAIDGERVVMSADGGRSWRPRADL